LFVRDFENGMVLVNPFTNNTKTYTLDKNYYKVVPSGGGIIDANANYDGQITFDTINGTISIPPVSALILMDSITINKINQKKADDILLNFYPNPFKNNITIEFNILASSIVSLEIFDITGKKVKTFLHNSKLEKNSYQFVWNTKLPKGTYFCVLTINNKKTMKKIIKN